MKKWMEKFAAWMQRFMYGRYGTDALNKMLWIVALIFMILSCFLPAFWILAVLLLVWCCFRSYSRNIPKRQKECAVYLSFVKKCKNKLNLQKRIWKERKTHRYFRCKNCNAMMRVPKGKGKIEISCPKCHTSVVKKT
jgi:uncharacterized paraquat-inducible protein A